MIYSVFNWNTGKYDYYRGNGELPGQKPKYRRNKQLKSVKIENVLPVVPSNSINIGSGNELFGRVAVLQNDDQLTGDLKSSEMDDNNSNKNIIFNSAIGILSVYLFRKALIGILK